MRESADGSTPDRSETPEPGDNARARQGDGQSLVRKRTHARLGELAPLRGHSALFRTPAGSSLAERNEALLRWLERREQARVWPFSRTLITKVDTRTSVRTTTGHETTGINLASQDYLGLANHPRVVAAAHEAIDRHGLHSAGSPYLLGNTSPSLELESAISELLGMDHVLLYPTGWGAGYSVVAGIVGPGDHVVLDRLVHDCIQQGARAAAARVHHVDHLDVPAMLETASRVREAHPDGGILVVTEGLFSMDSDTPDLRALWEGCRATGATLAVDVAHDLGVLGDRGLGSLETHELLGQVDVVMGSFSKTFASNGGFIALRSRSLREHLKLFGGPHIFSNALSPVQASVVLEAMRITFSAEGDRLRADLARNVAALRSALSEHGIESQGAPSAIVPVLVGREGLGRTACRHMDDLGVLANLVEFPAVAIGKCRFRCQVMATHEPGDMRTAGALIARAIRRAADELTAIAPTDAPHP